MKKYYSKETARALRNFAVSGQKLDEVFIKAFALTKLACAQINTELNYLPKKIGAAIVESCQEIVAGKWHEQIVVDPMQGGAGTSTNMNFNEVIANISLEMIGEKIGEFDKIHPLQHVNLHQSTNDVYPTALRVAVLLYLQKLEKEIALLQSEFQKKEQQFKDILKLGRTQLQDALPMTLGMTFSAFSEAIARDRWRIFKSRERIKTTNLGGTAIGTGLNAPRKYIFKVTERLRRLSGLNISRSENLIDATQNLDPFVEISGMLKAFASNLMKISSDLRLLSSGPEGGFAEIKLPELQKGSSIMPGKINPVIPEMMNQISLKVMANDQLVTSCAASGNLELNQFLPLLAYAILDSLKLLLNSIPIFTKKCVSGIEANVEKCTEHLNKSKTLATVLVKKLGYEKVEELIQKAKEENSSIIEIISKEKLFPDEEIQEILSPEAMYQLGFVDEKK